ncbi:MAG: hypothetical protein K0U34_03700 [Alphaproteobacteria bacterium]|nr:hypothetical protein [Alphaproteobacteria bacterium]
MFQFVLKVPVLVCAIMTLAALLLESVGSEVALSDGVQRLVTTWSDATDAVWRQISAWCGFKIISVFRTASILLICCVGLYLSAPGMDPDAASEIIQEQSRKDILNFIAALSIVIVMAFQSILFTNSGNLAQAVPRFIGIPVAAASVAMAITTKLKLRFMTQGLWISVAIVAIVLGLNYFMLGR